LVIATTLTAPVLAQAARLPGESPAPQQQVQTNLEGVYRREDNSLRIGLFGPIGPGQAEFIKREFDKYRHDAETVILFLNSAGGLIGAGEQIIKVLREIRLTHTLKTIVMPSWHCASMCVPIYLQGEYRLAGGASLWGFHDAAWMLNQDGSKAVLSEKETLRLYQKYYLKAGVQADWIIEVLNKTAGGRTYYQSGLALVQARSGIITGLIEDVMDRPEIVPEEPQRHSSN
jgi:ATP-dependent protease ClpP protease subunit